MALTKVTGQVIKNTTDVTVGVLTVTNTLAVGGTVSIGGTLTYEDVTNVDAVGLITARNGIVVGSGITLSKDGDVFFTGIATGNGSGLTALNASNLGSGTVPTARLGSGTASSSTFLRGDSTFQTVNTDLVSDTSPQLGGNLDTNDKNIVFADSDGGSGADNRAVFGASSDLQIYHDGGGSKITHANTGDLIINNTSGDTWLGSNGVVRISNASNNGYMAKFDEDGAAELYHDGTKRFETTSGGVSITGNCNVDGNITLSDSEEIQIGNSTDFRIYHDGNNTFLRDVGTGSLSISGSQVSLDSSNLAEYMVRAIENGAVELYHNGIKKLQTNDTYGTICSNTTDNAAYTNALLLTRRGYETSGYGVIFQAKGGSASGQNGLNIRLGTGSGSYLDKFTFDNDGLKFNGDTAAGNALADYEEGVFTPTIEFSTSTSVSYSGSSRNAEYVKVGKLVYIRLFVYASSTGTNSGTLKVGGLPFTPNSGGYGRHACSVTGGTFNLGSNLAGLFGLIEESVAKIDIYCGSVNGANTTISSSMWNGSGMYVAGVYHILGY